MFCLGLRSLFPLFMRSPQKTKKKDTAPDEHEEYVISVSSKTPDYIIKINLDY